ncbi:hypothetical protein MHYP_G00196620 [Metynnis hypsauchen]
MKPWLYMCVQPALLGMSTVEHCTDNMTIWRHEPLERGLNLETRYCKSLDGDSFPFTRQTETEKSSSHPSAAAPTRGIVKTAS